MFKKIAALVIFAAIAIPTLAIADPSISENAGQRYITIQTYWSDMSAADRQAVVNKAVELTENEIAQKVPQINNPTLQNSLLSRDFATQLQTELVRYLDGISDLEGSKYGVVRKAAIVLPRALLITVGASGGWHWTFGAKASMDLGVVVMLPSFKTVIDTAQKDSQNKPLIIESDQVKWLDAAMVGVPHAYAGVGVGGGATLSVGVEGIWGKMSSPEDFHGAFAALSGGMQIPVTALAAVPGVGQLFAPLLAIFPDGADLDLGAVVNTAHFFLTAKLGMDKGAEAAASVDGEGGAILSWSDFVAGVQHVQNLGKDIGNLFGGSSNKNQDSGNDSDENSNNRLINHSQDHSDNGSAKNSQN